MKMRGSTTFLLFSAVCLLIFFLLPLHARHADILAEKELRAQLLPLRGLQLTDLSLSTEARYTRHPALADRHAPFQDHPLGLEHFPSGSLILPQLSLPGKP
jgi:hypothetical protein